MFHFREVWRDNFSISKIVLIGLLQALNWGFFIYGAVVRPSRENILTWKLNKFQLFIQGISSYLLYIFIANLLVYTSYYIAMKFVNKEKINLPTIVYAILALAFWIPGDNDLVFQTLTVFWRPLLLSKSTQQLWWNSSTVKKLQQRMWYFQFLWLPWYLAFSVCCWDVLLLPPIAHSWWRTSGHWNSIYSDILNH